MDPKAILITSWLWFPALTTVYAEADSDMFLVCDSPACLERAKLLNESLNNTIDPCTDFYSYVCNTWKSSHSIPRGRNRYDAYQAIRENIQEKLSRILGKGPLLGSDQTIVDKAAMMYNACLALPDGRDALNKVLNESGFHRWPVLTEENIFGSSNCSDLFRHMNISPMFDVKTQKSRGKCDVWIETTHLTKKIMNSPNIKVVINNTIKFLNPQINSSTLDNLTYELVHFAEKLSKMIKHQYSPQLRHFSALQGAFTNIPISDLLHKELAKFNITLEDKDVSIVLTRYLAPLDRILRNVSPNTLYNFLGFLTIYPYVPYVNMSTEEGISNEGIESTTRSRNSTECIDLMEKSASYILDYLYVTNEASHAAAKNEVEEIGRRLQHEFNETFRNNSWVDNTALIALQEKLQRMPLQVGYPDRLLNISVLEDLYKYVPDFPLGISFTEALYYMTQNLYKRELLGFWYPQKVHSNWDYSPRDAVDYFKYSVEKIEIPYALLESPFFVRGLPRSLNYGGIGVKLAHELARRLSIKDGTRDKEKKHIRIISNYSIAFFNKKISCFERQYRVVNTEALKEYGGWSKVSPSVFANKTLLNDLPDNTALQTAYQVYREVLEEECSGIDTRLAGLENITGLQLFFIAHARTMCAITNRDGLQEQIDSWSYSPARNRVNEAMKNMKDFAKAFNCSADSAMANHTRCSFW